ncbi:unnamed protein product [Rotaria sordida]|uniref:Peptidase M28 domain-containing protein n=1 Tax=Rotaria sordida TaxID=392033 RepID=A0A816ED76_9BILA|nr:unnamed protein product [Rotaria sordida]CAF1644480.1 unnamed protein product [Rotaria sordida]
MNNNPVSNEGLSANNNNMILSLNKRVKSLSVCIGIGIILILVTLALAAATLGVVVNRLKDKPIDRPSLDSEYAESIQISDIMIHLNELQNIATNTGGNRAINTIGFNQTLDYINNYLSFHTNFKVATKYFYVKNFILASNSILITSINGVTVNRIFSPNLSIAEFYFVQYTRSVNFADYVPISVIPNEGCSDNDWLAANSSPNGQVALVKRGVCPFVDRAVLASRYPVGNICADTPTGDATQTIVIGGHSDSVPASPGINDNGSGSVANLGLAVALARLFETSTYKKYKYRVRFCW